MSALGHRAILFDNTPLSSLLKQISSADAATTRVIVINLFPNEGAIPKNMLEVSIWLNTRCSARTGVELGGFLPREHRTADCRRLSRCGEGAGQPAEDSRRSQSGYRAANVTTAYVRKDAHGTMLRNHYSLRDVRQTCKNLFKDL
jgi:hypothetical protein